jgi:hypothetical protein
VFPAALDELASACRDQDISFHYVVLEADLSTCIERAGARGDARPDTAGLSGLHARFESSGANRRHVIDASGPAEEVAARVLAGIRSGALAA